MIRQAVRTTGRVVQRVNPDKYRKPPVRMTARQKLLEKLLDLKWSEHTESTPDGRRGKPVDLRKQNLQGPKEQEDADVQPAPQKDQKD